MMELKQRNSFIDFYGRKMKGKLWKILFWVIVFNALLIWFSHRSNDDEEIEPELPFEKIRELQQQAQKINNIQTYQKYLSADYKVCSGLGNQIFRFANYYGIGQEIGRSPFFHANKLCQIKALKEIRKIFPNMWMYSNLMVAAKNESKYITVDSFLDNNKSLSNVEEKFLIFDRNLPQHYIYFDKYQSDIKYFTKFDDNLVEDVKERATKLFRDNNNHKFCIHIRRGDFLSPSYKYQASTSDFIEAASINISSFLRNSGHSKVSILLLGQDESFKKALKLNSRMIHQIYNPEFPSRGHDLVFASTFCDTFLITASISTFAWWMAYLMPDGRNIFYNAQVLKHGNYSEGLYQKVFPPHWRRLDLS